MSACRVEINAKSAHVDFQRIARKRRCKEQPQLSDSGGLICSEGGLEYVLADAQKLRRTELERYGKPVKAGAKQTDMF